MPANLRHPILDPRNQVTWEHLATDWIYVGTHGTDDGASVTNDTFATKTGITLPASSRDRYLPPDFATLPGHSSYSGLPYVNLNGAGSPFAPFLGGNTGTGAVEWTNVASTNAFDETGEGMGYDPVRFRRDASGIVHMQGTAVYTGSRISTSTSPSLVSVVFRLPSEFRPVGVPRIHHFLQQTRLDGGYQTTLQIEDDGFVTLLMSPVSFVPDSTEVIVRFNHVRFPTAA